MSLATDLDTITDNSQNQAVTSAQTFFSGSGKTAIANFLKSKAEQGLREARVSIYKGRNNRAYSRSGFSTLSGELSSVNSELSQGISVRNGIGTVFLDIDETDTDQFQQVVEDFVDDLITVEGLDVEAVYGVTVSNLLIQW